MNCKQGDLAIIINDPDFDGADCGKIVKIVCLAASGDLGPEWECHSQTPMYSEYEFTFEVHKSFVVDIPDAWLKPVSGLPMEEFIDEQLPIAEKV